jgi:fused signal recognition particle receptor
MITMFELATYLPMTSCLFARQSATPGADSTGLLVVFLVVGAMLVAAVILTRKPPSRRPPKEAGDRRAVPEAKETTSKQARDAAKALRRAAHGVVKVSSSGEREQIDAVDFTADPSAEAIEDIGVAVEPVLEPDANEVTREKLEAGLSKTRQEGFVARLGKLFQGKQIDEALLDQIEEVLYRADIGVQATTALLESLKQALSRKELTDAEMVWSTLRKKCLEMLRQVDHGPLALEPENGPAVLMVVGVNGSGKTTTIGKLSQRFARQGRHQLVAAGDTYRAAAVDQLEVWCQRAGVALHRGKDNADPGSVCYSAVKRAQDEGFDLVVVDTAGRLHTNKNLMAELQKVSRVCSKAHEGAPHEVLLVLDATMGQNAVQQAKVFKEALNVTAIALTKLDGTAKGGVVLAIAETLQLPVKLIGVGEKLEDLRDFDPELFIDALFARGPIAG